MRESAQRELGGSFKGLREFLDILSGKADRFARGGMIVTVLNTPSHGGASLIS
jgi:hypothetical protein